MTGQTSTRAATVDVAAPFTTHTSTVDNSVNFTTTRRCADMDSYPGMIETRFVQREPDYFIVYLSSQTGCSHGCRMCHLTQTAQTAHRDVTVDAITTQAATVFDHYLRRVEAGSEPAQRVHFNFMARGEPFASTAILENGDRIVDLLSNMARRHNLRPHIKFSTIFPNTFADMSFDDVFAHTSPDLYYSLYTIDPERRRRWLPRAAPPETALAALARWQHRTSLIPWLHFALIDGINDTVDDIADVCAAVRNAGLYARVNLVRYNPPGERFGTEPDEPTVERCATQLAESTNIVSVRVVPRVGYDVAASCGMFFGGREQRVGVGRRTNRTEP